MRRGDGQARGDPYRLQVRGSLEWDGLRVRCCAVMARGWGWYALYDFMKVTACLLRLALVRQQPRRFLELCPKLEKYIVEGGITLIKVWLEVGDHEQKRRFEARLEDPLRQWKLSPVDLPSRSKWFEYSRARDMMLKATDTPWAPWSILPADDKKRARLNGIRHILTACCPKVDFLLRS